jgi:multidrug efflux pump
MQEKLRQLVDIIRRDPAVDTVVGFTGGSRAGGGFMFINLKPAVQRTDGGQAVIARLRPQAGAGDRRAHVPEPGAGLAHGRTFQQFHLPVHAEERQPGRPEALGHRLADAMKRQPALIDVDTDQAENGVETFVKIDRDSASRLGVNSRDVDNALYNSFGQRQVATIYDELNQYRDHGSGAGAMPPAPSRCAMCTCRPVAGATTAHHRPGRRNQRGERTGDNRGRHDQHQYDRHRPRDSSTTGTTATAARAARAAPAPPPTSLRLRDPPAARP